MQFDFVMRDSHRFGLTPDVSILTLCLPEPTFFGNIFAEKDGPED
jgi:hypothetical protein